ncbi:hypothetical protein LJC58_01065 [Lachnospiraceae bacterium OttesenSCG-928-D06]|nr:hypothetical protein [Lachnospiraceae bacterium OttesenSCG-928-D06]
MDNLMKLARKLAVCFALVLLVGGMWGNGMKASANTVSNPRITWDENVCGKFWFDFYQEKDTVFHFEFYCNGVCLEKNSFNYNSIPVDSFKDYVGSVLIDFMRYAYFYEEGEYLVKGRTENVDGTYSDWVSTEPFNYVCPEESLQAPINVKRDSEGTVIWEFPADSNLKELFSVFCYDSEGFQVSPYDNAAVAVRAISSNPNVIAHSDLVPVEGSESEEQKPTNVWKPTTAEEVKRTSFKSSVPVKIQSVTGTNREVSITGEIQGQKYIDAVESILGNYTIGATFNILIDNGKTYLEGDTIQISMAVPKALMAENRTYIMITVDENGVPHILQDLDSNDSTITFSCEKGYAYSLCFLDK